MTDFLNILGRIVNGHKNYIVYVLVTTAKNLIAAFYSIQNVYLTIGS